MFRIALTGGIASGKSTVAGLFEDRGVPVVRTDEISRQVVRRGSDGLRAVVTTFGEAVLDETGALDRKRLRQIVFAEESRRKELEAILHPLIQGEVDRRLRALEATGNVYAIVEIPLLVETGAASRYDRVLLVDCSPTVQLERLRERDGVDEDDARDALASQADREQRLAVADDIIDNSHASMEALDQAVQSLHERYSAMK